MPAGPHPAAPADGPAAGAAGGGAGGAAAAGRAGGRLVLVGGEGRRVLRNRAAPGHDAAVRHHGGCSPGPPLARQPALLAPGDHRARRARRARRLGGPVGALEPGPGHRDRRRPADPHLRARLRPRHLAQQPVRSRLHLALVPLAVAGAFAGIVAVVGMLTGDDVRHYLELDGTLEFPLGYRNANAAFFAIALWPALGLASHRASAWPLRAAALATATLCLDLAMLSQSRGSLPAARSRSASICSSRDDRARRLAWLALAAASGAADPARPDRPLPCRERRRPAALRARTSCTGRGGRSRSPAPCSLAIGAAAALLGKRVPASPRRVKIADRAAVVGLVAVVLAGSVAFVVVGRQSDRLDRQARFPARQRTRTPTCGPVEPLLDPERRHSAPWDLAGRAAGRARPPAARRRRRRLSLHLSARAASLTPRSSVQRRAQRRAREPLRVRLSGADPVRRARSGRRGVGAMRARRLGPEPAWLSIIALTAGAYWLVHASLDWFWPYPAITAPVFALLGSACAPALRIVGDAPRGRGGSGSPPAPWCSRSRRCPRSSASATSTTAYDEWRSDPSGAYDDLDRARSPEPAERRAAARRGRHRAGRTEIAPGRSTPSAGRPSKRPEEWASHYNLAELYARRSPRLARQQLAIAKRGIHTTPQVMALEDASSRPSGGRGARLSPPGRMRPPAGVRQLRLIIPCWSAMATAWALVRAPSLALALRTCVCTVAGESSSISAICSSVAPAASRVSTSRSREVGPPRPKRGPLLTSAARPRDWARASWELRPRRASTRSPRGSAGGGRAARSPPR